MDDVRSRAAVCRAMMDERYVVCSWKYSRISRCLWARSLLWMKKRPMRIPRMTVMQTREGYLRFGEFRNCRRLTGYDPNASQNVLPERDLDDCAGRLQTCVVYATVVLEDI